MLTWILSLKTPALVLYVFWCIGISSFALSSFTTIIQEYLAIQYDYSAEALMVMGQVGFQWLLILPLVAYHNFFTTSSVWATVYSFIVVGVIFVIHHRLVVRKKLPTILTYTWVLYRLSLLIYLVFPVQRSL